MQKVFYVMAMVGCLAFVPSAFAAAPAVDPALCRAAVEYVEPPGVEYQPGVDVHGKKVAPADLPGSAQMKLPEKIEIPLTIQLAKVLNFDFSQYPFNTLGTGTEVQLGTLTVEGNRVSYNGQPLSDAQQDALAAACGEQEKMHQDKH